MLAVIREEMQEQGMKLVEALLTGIGAVNITSVQSGTIPNGAELSKVCDGLPGELQGVLAYFE